MQSQSRPLFLKILPYIATFIGFSGLIAVLWLLSGIGTVKAAGQGMSDQEILTYGALQLGLCAIAAFTIAFGFWKERPWSRHILIVCLALLITLQLWRGLEAAYPFEIGPFATRLPFPPEILTLLLAVWYLYFKPNVRAYYRKLKEADLYTAGV